MGKAGDGKRSGFEGSFWNWTRSDEKNALVSQDRADHMQARADYKKELNDGMTAAEELDAATAQSVVADARGRPIADRGSRKAHKRVQKQLQALHKVNESQSKEIDALRTTLVDVLDELGERDGAMGTGLDWMIGLTAAGIRILNVGDKIHQPWALQLAEVITAAEIMGWSNGNKAIRLGGNLLTAYAYYDPRVGLSSLFTTDRVRAAGVGGALAQALGSLGSSPAPAGGLDL